MADIGKIQPREIVEEMKESYLDYAMSVIISRALPDVRDGLKPVQRRILYTLHEMGLGPAAKFRKSAAVVGTALANYHPHGDLSVYDALVRMAQDFAFRYPLVDGQGNFGCFTGDTKVQLIDGRTLSFIELIEDSRHGRKNYTYTYNHKTKQVEIAEIKAPRRTRTNAELVKVTLDNGTEIRCTHNHLFMRRDGSYTEAKNLKRGDSLMPFSLRLSTKEDDPNIIGYEMTYQPNLNKWEYTHHLADKWNIRHDVYPRSAGKIRHHIDFNKRNNKPENVRRVQWAEHWRAHYEFTSLRHKIDSEYRKKLEDGRKAYYATEEAKQKNAERIRAWNIRMWRDPWYRKLKQKALQELWKNPEYRERMAHLASKRLKKKWQEEWFRRAVGEKKSREMKKRWQDSEYRKFRGLKMREISQKIWENPAHRQKISGAMKEMWKDDAYREKHAALAKARWADPEYRCKFPREHFVKAARTLWKESEMRTFHRNKIKKQWQYPAFRERVSLAVSLRNERRQLENPKVMERLTERARTALRIKWQDPQYRKRVMRSKILRFVSGLIAEYRTVTPELYQRHKKHNWVPRIENISNYFADFQEVVTQARHYNHRVIKVEFLPERENVYDLTVGDTHNFALAAGVFVHNSVDGDPAAAQRYTETRMSWIANELLRGIEKDTVDFRPNYDNTRSEPSVLPSSLPNLLLNGTMGIAVGMATSIPPHNLGEVLDALQYLIDHPKANNDELMEFIKGPDFPTGGIIYNQTEIRQAYSTGRGSILVRAKAEIVEKSQKSGPEEVGKARQIIITEIPYQVVKSELIEKIAELVRDKKIEGIRDLRDESDKEGLRIAVDLKSDHPPQKVLNSLYAYTDLEKNFNLNMLALVDGIQPQVLSIRGILEEYLRHREVVITRRSQFELKRAKERAHILEGLTKALADIDRVIALIKKSADRDIAHANLVKTFGFSAVQATAILEMKLQTLAGLERKKIEEELTEKRALIKELEALLKERKKILEVMKKEFSEIKTRYADSRRTEVVKHALREFAVEDLIAEEEAIIVLTRGGYIKRMKPEVYRVQRRGGKGVAGIETKEEDAVLHFLTANTHADLLFFTSTGKVFQTKVYEIPEGSRLSKGKAIFNFLSIRPEERILSLVARPKKGTPGAGPAKYLIMSTQHGMIKKLELEALANVRKSGIVAITLKKDDALRSVALTGGKDEVILLTSAGRAIRFRESDVRAMGRGASGVKALRLKKGDSIIGMSAIAPLTEDKKAGLLVIFANGFGKKTAVGEFRHQKRGGSGLKAAKVTAKNGPVVSTHLVKAESELIAISQKGQVIRTRLSDVPTLSRATQGVRIMKLEEGDAIASTTIL